MQTSKKRCWTDAAGFYLLLLTCWGIYRHLQFSTCCMHLENEGISKCPKVHASTSPPPMNNHGQMLENKREAKPLLWLLFKIWLLDCNSSYKLKLGGATSKSKRLCRVGVIESKIADYLFIQLLELGEWWVENGEESRGLREKEGTTWGGSRCLLQIWSDVSKGYLYSL